MIMSWTKTIANKYVVHQCICLFCYIWQTGAWIYYYSNQIYPHQNRWTQKFKINSARTVFRKLSSENIIVFCSRMYMENGKQTGGLYRRSAWRLSGFRFITEKYVFSIIKCSSVNINLEVAHSLALLLYFILLSFQDCTYFNRADILR